MMQREPLGAVFFDLDGTLLDTAPDMVGALNELCVEHAVPPVDYQRGRAYVSNGAIGLINLAFEDIGDPERERLRGRFLELYAGRLADATDLFAGMEPVLNALDAADVAWGVVTNKPASLTHPLLDALELTARCACIVSGDTLPERKPHPGPLLHALAQIGSHVKGSGAMYVGDSDRDMRAGNAAGMVTVAAAYGFIPPEDDPHEWNADHIIGSPAELFGILEAHGAIGPAG